MKYTTILCITFLAMNVHAGILIKNSTVTDVTIYRSYAKETRLGSASIPQGNSEVIITNITSAIDENSIQVGCKNNVKILSVSSRLNYLPDETTPNPFKIKNWQDSVKLLDKKSRYTTQQKDGYEAELNVLNTNNKLAGDSQRLKPSLLKELLELNRIKQAELKKLIFDANEEYNDMRNTMALLQNQINQSDGQIQGKPIREIVLKVNSKTEVNTQFRISYLVTSASWTPTYEIRCESVAKPLLLSCRAKIIQNSGFDWKNVHIKLSTANPTQNHNRPVLYPIYVDFMQPDYYSNRMQAESKKSGYKNMMNEKAPEAPPSVQMMSGAQEAYNDKDFVNGLKVDENAVTISEGEMMVEYTIEQDQDIESDGQEHVVAIQELTISAQYNYHSVPKLDNAVFLLARISDWGKYNLLAGDATLFFEDMYVGKSYINPNVSADTLLISLGRDEKININRTRLNDLCTTKKFSNKKRETKAFETVVKNNKNIPIEIEILDQYPVSRNSEIEVSLEEGSGAEITKEYGKMLWRIKLQPGESKKIKTVYSIKFPDDKMVAEKN